MRHIAAYMSKGAETAIQETTSIVHTYAHNIGVKVHLTQHPASENDHHQVHFLQTKSLGFMGESYELSRF